MSDGTDERLVALGVVKSDTKVCPGHGYVHHKGELTVPGRSREEWLALGPGLEDEVSGCAVVMGKNNADGTTTLTVYPIHDTISAEDVTLVLEQIARFLDMELTVEYRDAEDGETMQVAVAMAIPVRFIRLT